MRFTKRLERARAWISGDSPVPARRAVTEPTSALLGSIEYEIHRMSREVSAIRLDPTKVSAWRQRPVPTTRVPARFVAGSRRLGETS